MDVFDIHKVNLRRGGGQRCLSSCVNLSGETDGRKEEEQRGM